VLLRDLGEEAGDELGLAAVRQDQRVLAFEDKKPGNCSIRLEGKSAE
jgi:hypothetical protein